jgi:hypothetical protein
MIDSRGGDYMAKSGQTKTVNKNNSCFFNIPAKQFSLLSSIIGISLIDDLDVNEQNALGNFLVNMGQNILTAAAQSQANSDDNNQSEDLSSQIDLLKNHICLLENQIKNR